MKKIFLLGTFHFSKDDAFTEEAQRQLQSINESLARFNPDAIAVEAAAHAQSEIDASYEKFSLDALSDFDKMRSETLGQLYMFGKNSDIGYENEAVQIGYRLGKTIGASKIHAIDDDTNLDAITGEIPVKIKQAFEAHMKKMDDSNLTTIRDRIRFLNSDEWSYHFRQLYILTNVMGAGTNYEGAKLYGQWYTRNLKIFANLQKLCESHDRIFVLYGAGHLHVLRELINACDDMQLADCLDFF